MLAAPSDKTASDLSGDTSYSTYLATKAANMTASLVVNANDGFVSVINTANGARRYAYMPASVLPSLRYIADTAYINGVGHKFLVDGQVGRVRCPVEQCLEDPRTGRNGGGRANLLCAATVRRIGGQCCQGAVGNQRAGHCQSGECFQ